MRKWVRGYCTVAGSDCCATEAYATRSGARPALPGKVIKCYTCDMLVCKSQSCSQLTKIGGKWAVICHRCASSEGM